MKKSFCVLLVVIFVIMMGMTGCGAKEEVNAFTDKNGDGVFTIGFSNWDDGDIFCKLLSDEMVRLCGEDDRFDIIAMDASGDINKQVYQVETFVEQGCDAVVFIPIDSTGCIPAVEACNEAGIPVICLCTDTVGGDKIYVGCNNYEAGAVVGTYLAENLPENSGVVWLAGVEGETTETLRFQGFSEKLLDVRPDVTLLAKQTGNFNRSEGMSIMEDWIQAFGDQITAVASSNDQMALGAMEALKSSSIDDVMICGIDGTEEAMHVVAEDGMYKLTAFQNGPHEAAAAFKYLNDILVNGIDSSTLEDVIVPFEGITIDNAQEHIDTYFPE
jgi:ABC-type sugar transport system, periplasmic component